VPAFRSSDPAVAAFRRVPIVLALIAALFGACSGAASQPPTTSPPTSGALPSAAVSSSPSGAPAATFPITLTDDDRTPVALAAEPRKIVSLTPAETEILFALGAGDRVVGKVEDIANYPPQAKDVPIVGTFSGIDVEKIVGADPDLVIAGGSGGTPKEAIDKLRALGLAVLVVYAPDVTGVLHDIELTGAAIGRPAEAAALATSMRSGFDQVATAMADASKPRVFYETGDTPSIYGIADHSVYAQMIELAGGMPITTGSATNWEMSTEKLVAADPQLIILGDAAYGVTAAAVAKRPGWAGLAAVKAKAIKPIDDIIVTRPGPRLVDGLRLLVAAIHPEVVLPPAPPSPSPSGG
jgi:iron complex transport system substrate-binding protein